MFIFIKAVAEPVFDMVNAFIVYHEKPLILRLILLFLYFYFSGYVSGEAGLPPSGSA